MSCRVVGQLEEQLKNAQSQVADHVTQLGVANKMVTVLQEQLIVSRQEQAEMKSELVQLKEENSLLHESLRNTQQVSLYDMFALYTKSLILSRQIKTLT